MMMAFGTPLKTSVGLVHPYFPDCGPSQTRGPPRLVHSTCCGMTSPQLQCPQGYNCDMVRRCHPRDRIKLYSTGTVFWASKMPQYSVRGDDGVVTVISVPWRSLEILAETGLRC
ncbi:hypothetical protein BD324DRAFT_127711 [Kockovaella imperatae]|uniref:Uncharacterized protein n=1 Tax=Kockovaella imperatae TaxID=4999 RepID=A0A1Y1U9L2_9TREE|nr:hypothetical protein BD324DRAFT_127711 [Kockovaella imperatae]ORX34702.1 hypothetical protein BD324DRAFT_127711 [Kockovaella imperatae]